MTEETETETEAEAPAEENAEATDAETAAAADVPSILLPIEGIGYIVHPNGDITAPDGSPLPEEHPISHSHSRIAAERKDIRQ
jgi:hypothetical protein